MSRIEEEANGVALDMDGGAGSGHNLGWEETCCTAWKALHSKCVNTCRRRMQSPR